MRGVRDRYDGRRRNPWNEVECGSHYARALSSWSLILALSGFSFSGPERRLGFAPRVNASDFRCFFSAGDGWGTYSQRVDKKDAFEARLDVRYGTVPVRHLRLRNEAAWRGASISPIRGPGVAAAAASVRANGESLDVDLGRIVVVAEGQALCLVLKPSAATT